jgi:hypothetical protein
MISIELSAVEQVGEGAAVADRVPGANLEHRSAGQCHPNHSMVDDWRTAISRGEREA